LYAGGANSQIKFSSDPGKSICRRIKEATVNNQPDWYAATIILKTEGLTYMNTA